MTWWSDFWRKPSSVAGHLAWGFVVADLMNVFWGWSDSACIFGAMICGIAWEVVPELVTAAMSMLIWIDRPTARSWHARAWDVTPWLLGGFAWALVGWIAR